MCRVMGARKKRITYFLGGGGTARECAYTCLPPGSKEGRYLAKRCHNEGVSSSRGTKDQVEKKAR